MWEDLIQFAVVTFWVFMYLSLVVCVCDFDDGVSCGSYGADSGLVGGYCGGGYNGGWIGFGVYNCRRAKDQS